MELKQAIEFLDKVLTIVRTHLEHISVNMSHIEQNYPAKTYLTITAQLRDFQSKHDHLFERYEGCIGGYYLHPEREDADFRARGLKTWIVKIFGRVKNLSHPVFPYNLLLVYVTRWYRSVQEEVDLPVPLLWEEWDDWDDDD
jgi:hypothetical protein